MPKQISLEVIAAQYDYSKVVLIEHNQGTQILRLYCAGSSMQKTKAAIRSVERFPPVSRAAFHAVCKDIRAHPEIGLVPQVRFTSFGALYRWIEAMRLATAQMRYAESVLAEQVVPILKKFSRNK